MEAKKTSGGLGRLLRGTPVTDLGLGTEASRHLARRTITTVEELRSAISVAPSLAAVLDPGRDGKDLRESLTKFKELDAPPPPRVKLGDRLGLLSASGPPGVSTLDAPSPSNGLPEPSASQVDAADLIATFHDRLPSPRDQLYRPTCVAHALAAAAELSLNADGLMLSPQFVHHHAKQIDRAPADGGTYLWAAVDQMKSAGICEEHHWPYDGSKKPDYGVPTTAAIADAALRRAAASSASSPSMLVRDLMTSLDRDEPVVIGVHVFAVWDSDAVRSSGKVLLPEDDAVPTGGHALCLVGYGYSPAAFGSEHPYFFLARNSWGTWWAPDSPIAAGHVLLSARYIELHGLEVAQLAYES